MDKNIQDNTIDLEKIFSFVLTFLKDKIEIDNLSHLISINNDSEIDDFKNYLKSEIINIALFCNKTNELELLQINNNFVEIFNSELNNFIN